jgi:hypothetical protein
MRQTATTIAIACAVVLIGAGSARAQWGRESHPSRGACFYENANYQGRYFCAAVGRDASTVPIGSNDQISSIRIYGSAEVVVFKDSSFRGDKRRFTSSMSNLSWIGWGDKISSYRIEDRREDSYSGWGGAYGGGGWGGGDRSHGDDWGGAYGGGSRNNWNNKDGGRWTYREAEDIVKRAYRSVLRREPDSAAAAWTGEVMKNNWSQRDLEEKLMQSPEYRNKAFKR